MEQFLDLIENFLTSVITFMTQFADLVMDKFYLWESGSLKWVKTLITIFIFMPLFILFLSFFTSTSLVQNIVSSILKNYKKNSPLEQEEHPLPKDIVEKLENKWCKISYDVFNRKIVCENKEITDEYKKKFTITQCYNVSYGALWQIITNNFNENMKYKTLRKNLSEYAYIIDESTEIDTQNIIKNSTSCIKIVDVNSANEEILIVLPGINRIQAKKIIKFRERERYFNSREDFFETMQIKKHFQKQMKFLVVANPVERKQFKDLLNEKERKVDL